MRTTHAPWGYHAREILSLLEQKGFRWFAPIGKGDLVNADRALDFYDHNLVAVPEWRMQQIQPLLQRVSA